MHLKMSIFEMEAAFHGFNVKLVWRLLLQHFALINGLNLKRGVSEKAFAKIFI